MKSKHLLLLLLLICSGLLSITAQPYTNLIYTEVRMDHTYNAYIEITNMGSETVNLNRFKHNSRNPGSGFVTNPSYRLQLPDKLLAPGESWVVVPYYDFAEIMGRERPLEYNPSITKPGLKLVADQFVYPEESGPFPNVYDPTRDSISFQKGSHSFWSWNGREGGYYLEWFNEDRTDSVVIDAVNLKWNGTTAVLEVSDVAGVTAATLNSVLIRKANVTQGNLDWDASRGTDLVDSEWLPVPKSTPYNIEFDREPFWTVGNHGDYRLDATTLVSTDTEVVVDFAAKQISVPWGIRNNDSIMNKMERKPGISWYYNYSTAREDSAYTSIRNGDAITIYVAGNQLDMAKFDFVVRAQENSDNIVIPKNRPNFVTNIYPGFRGAPYKVSDGVQGMDTIENVPYGTRVDSLLLYLEKPVNATWQIVFKDGEVRSDLKDGDKLAVTAQNNDVKEYYIKVTKFLGSTNVNLSSITWPDIPEFYKGLFGWKGDTIPQFSPTNYVYVLTVPFDVQNIPALVVKQQDPNSTVEITRAKSFVGNDLDRTITIRVTASNGININTYSILLNREKAPADIQPWAAEPFISQYSHDEQGYQSAWNHAAEFFNPGTELIDFSNYMVIKGDGTPADVISNAGISWTGRKNRYIPGYQWADSITWSLSPGMMVPDLNVDPFMYGGEAWVIASAGYTDNYQPYHRFESTFNVNFKSPDNPWRVPHTDRYGTAVSLNNNNTLWLFRIDNDSIKSGLKPTTDPNDFTLIDVFGKANNTSRLHVNDWDPNRTPVSGNVRVYFRKAHIYAGNTVPGSMFHPTDPDSSEYYSYNRADMRALFGYNYTDATNMVLGWLGIHNIDEVTFYQSTILSNAYRLTEGYSADERMWGITTGTTVDNFLLNIIKKNEGQQLTVTNSEGVLKEGAAVINEGDLLVVVSSDLVNTTKYKLEVSALGLSNNAVLTSTLYTIDISGNTGTISGVDYNTLVQTVLDNVVLPEGASLTVVDGDDNYVPFKKLNNDTVYIDVKVTNQIFLEVVAENGVDKILYQLNPAAQASDAFVTSMIYDVNETLDLIDLVNSGVIVSAFLDNLVPAKGASMMIYDKTGFQRIDGGIKSDDYLLVTAEDGVTTKQYFINFLGQTGNLAYVLSDVYMVNQNAKTISDEAITGAVSPAALISNLTPSTGASIMVVDNEGAENSTTNLKVGDRLKVTASDGVTVVYYTIVFNNVGIDPSQKGVISVYPNPTSATAVISGAEIGNTISVYNSLGVMIHTLKVDSDRQVLSLEKESTGFYYVVIKDSGKILDRVILMKK